MPYDSIEGLEHIDKVTNVDQSPIGRTPRSNPATYTGVFADIRSLFVNLPEAQIRGYKPDASRSMSREAAVRHVAVMDTRPLK